VNLPLLLALSVISDVDLLIPGLRHRGATHSLLMCTLLFIPAFIVYKRRALPYFASLTQHSLIGDYIFGKVQLLWPLNKNWYGMRIPMMSITDITVEWIFFAASAAILFKTEDGHSLLQRKSSNLFSCLSVFTIILPLFFSFPLSIPSELMIPHLTFLALLQLSTFTGLLCILEKHPHLFSIRDRAQKSRKRSLHPK